MNNDTTFLNSADEQLEQEYLKETLKGAKGHFFVVSLHAIQEIVHRGGLAEDVMSYLSAR